MPVPEAFRRGREAFNEGRFFEAHEHWEEVWKAAPAEARPYYQALIQLSAACLKIERREYAPARQLLIRAVKGLRAATDGSPGGLDAIRAQVQETLDRLTAPGSERASEFDPRWYPRLGPDPE